LEKVAELAAAGLRTVQPIVAFESGKKVAERGLEERVAADLCERSYGSCGRCARWIIDQYRIPKGRLRSIGIQNEISLTIKPSSYGSIAVAAAVIIYLFLQTLRMF
jgi:hypothetical protein